MTMARSSWTDLRADKLAAMSPEGRREFDRGYAEAALAAEVGEHIRAAREEAGLTQRDLAERMGTSQASVARLEAGGVGATITTLHRVAVAVGKELHVELRSTG